MSDWAEQEVRKRLNNLLPDDFIASEGIIEDVAEILRQAYERGKAEASEPLPCGHPRACQREITVTSAQRGTLGVGQFFCAWCADSERQRRAASR